MFSLASIPHLARNARRFTEIAGVLAKYGLAEFLAATDTSFFGDHLKGPAGTTLSGLTREARLRLAMTELGATAVKIGQILSTRPDLVGPETAAELAKLRDDTAPDAPHSVRQTVETELGAPIAELFASFEDSPIASASIGQEVAFEVDSNICTFDISDGSTNPFGRIVGVLSSEIEPIMNDAADTKARFLIKVYASVYESAPQA